ncbi:MAG TPA: peptidase M23, partial [Candidatus Odoribacter faecigallinarum]|nr:peptidase M23 [Candidatus Odoribacter faecigallinarum]
MNKLLKDADKNKAVSTEKVNILQEKIVQSERVLHSLSQELAYLKKDISDNESRIAELEKRKESLLGMYANLVYETWKKRDKIDKLMFIFSSSDFNQAYNRFRYFQQIQDYSKRQLKLIEQVNDSLNIRNNELNHLVAQKNDLMVTINTKNREL